MGRVCYGLRCPGINYTSESARQWEGSGWGGGQGGWSGGGGGGGGVRVGLGGQSGCE